VTRGPSCSGWPSLAARAVVAALVEEVCAEGFDRPAIELDAQRQVVIVVPDARTTGPPADALHEALRLALERVPFKSELWRPSPAPPSA
jgi:hypothetical protein